MIRLYYCRIVGMRYKYRLEIDIEDSIRYSLFNNVLDVVNYIKNYPPEKFQYSRFFSSGKSAASQNAYLMVCEAKDFDSITESITLNYPEYFI